MPVSELASDRLRRALSAIDAANRSDPNQILVRGQMRPKELAHAELASEWIAELMPDASDELQLAARAHHICRWQRPRSDYPEGRVGYLRWRKELQVFHAEKTGEILASCGYGAESVERVQAIIRKRGLGRDAEVQALEDALCLVFLETQFHDLAERLEREKLLDVTRKTLKKMSPEAIARGCALPLEPADLALIEQAAAS